MSSASERMPWRAWLVEVFAFFNLAFLALDIYFAHSVNAFAHWAEWVPFFFSLLSPLMLVPALIRRRVNAPFARWGGMTAGVGAIVVGVSGMYFHLGSSFFVGQTLKALVYSAPFVAPLSYTGVGLLILLNRMEDLSGDDWAVWVVALAAFGFGGNFVLSVLDHAQNGFFQAIEWLSVVAAACGFSFLLMAVVRRGDMALVRAGMWVMAGQVLVGMFGFALHFKADMSGPASSLFENLVHGAPVFAPLLFANLALLAMLGLWAIGKPLGPQRCDGVAT